jgi:hypothetical protein
MPARRRPQNLTTRGWAGELRDAENGGELGPSELAGILHQADGRLREMWEYLRDVDGTSVTNLSGFEKYIEVVYRLIKPDNSSSPPVGKVVAEAVNRTLILIDEAKASSRVLRVVTEKSQARRTVTRDILNVDPGPLSNVAKDAEALTAQHNAVITAIDRLRTQMATVSDLFEKEAKRTRRSGPGRTFTTNKPDERRHHQPWSIAG